MPNIHDARDTYATTMAFLVSREEIPHLLNARGLFGCGVEVGVQQGLFSAHLLHHWHGTHLVSVDPWFEDAPGAYVDIANVPQETQEALYRTTCARLRPYGARSSVWRETSVDAARRIPHHSLDFVYLDARHDYASVMEDLEAWFDKVRPGGVLAGHDYLDGHFQAGIFGVKSAVDEFCAARGLRVHATLDDEPWLSWLVEIPAPASLFAASAASDEEPVRQAAPAPLPVAPPTGDRTVMMRFEVGGTPQQVELALDAGQMSQRFMIECFDRHDTYEPETTSFFAHALRPGDAFVDVGTHIGYFSLLASRLVGPTGKVISFEPEASNYDHLMRHIAINGMSNVEAIPSAVGEDVGEVTLYVNADNDGGHALWDVGAHPFNEQSRQRPEPRAVNVTSLDHFLRDREVGSLRLIKIDAEGSEHAVLRGARDSLLKHRVPYIVVEINAFALERMGTTDTLVRQMMEELGYESFLFMSNPGRLERLRLDQTVESNNVYNLLFRRPDVDQASAAA